MLVGWCLVGCMTLAATSEGDHRYFGRRLVDVLQEFQSNGWTLLYSSAVVDTSLLVTTEPDTDDPQEALRQMLTSLGLAVREGPNGGLLIVAATQNTGTLSGRIHSRIDDKPIAEAQIILPTSQIRVLSADDGSFTILGIEAGRYDVVVEAEGYTTSTLRQVRIKTGKEIAVAIRMSSRSAFLTEVVVTPSRHTVVSEELSANRTISDDEVVLAPTLGGDPTRVIELLPGVTAANSSASFNVRGSLARDTSLVLDGLELYDPFHLRDFQSPFSLIDSNVVERIDFLGGGYTADLGDRHGGFVDISTSASHGEFRGDVELGTLNSRISYQSPINGGKGSWLISARTWYPEAVADTTELGGGENLDPRFSDLYAKVAFSLRKKHRLSAHFLGSYDRLKFLETGEDVNEQVDALTRNTYSWVRLRSAWSEDWSSESVLSLGRIDRKRDGLGSEDGEVNVDDQRTVDFVGFKNDAVWQVSPSHGLKMGLDVRSLTAHYSYSRDVVEDPSESAFAELDPNGLSMSAYLAHRMRATEKLTTEIGVRWDRQDYTQDNQFSPRVNAVYRPNGRSEFRLAAGRFHQSQRIHELQVPDGETEFSAAEIAQQVELSYQHTLPAGLRFRVDGYFRKLTRLRSRYENLLEPIELFPEIIEDRVEISPDRARLRGIELLLRGETTRPFYWWVSYAYSEAEDRESGRWIPRSWDQPHAAKFLVGYRRADRWSLSLVGSAHTGWPTTPGTAVATMGDPGEDPFEVELGERNSDRFPRYVRYDLKARRGFALGDSRLWFTLEVVNLADRKNACCIDELLIVENPDGTAEINRLFDFWLGRTASFSVLWRF